MLQSLPVAFGTEAAKWICVGAIDVTQISVAGIEFHLLFFFLKAYFQNDQN